MNPYKIALIGNPNVGKTSLFNKLTNLRQKVGNYPGVTVEKREGTFEREGKKFLITDLPGTYSIFPNSLDEEIVYRVLGDTSHPNHPDLAVVVGEPSNLKRSILLYQQVKDLGIPAIFVINMVDEFLSKGLELDVKKLEAYLDTSIVMTNARTSEGIEELIHHFKIDQKQTVSYAIPAAYQLAVQEVKSAFVLPNDYRAWQYLAQKNVSFITDEQQTTLQEIQKKHQLIPRRLQVKETVDRNAQLDNDLNAIVSYNLVDKETLTEKIDKILIHPVWGYVTFFLVLLVMFQAVYTWAESLMGIVEDGFNSFNELVLSVLPEGPITELIGGAVIPGIAGIVVFVPQIAILFLFISLMEETGYMSRVVYLMDRWLKPFGLSGKSVVPLISGVACAVPAIMSARNIENAKERLLTILVTPFMTCAARLPIYLVIIALVIPDEKFLGFNIQGLVLFAMYLLGIIGAVGSAFILNLVIKAKHKSYLILEMPTYKLPDWKNVGINVWEKTMGFLIGAGKIIFAISIILWVLGSFGPGNHYSEAEAIVQTNNPNLSEDDLANEVASYKLEHSYLGKIGSVIEPLVEPLGYDWKIGIGLISSFAAREVFVGTMSTVYSLGEVDVDDENDKTLLLDRMRSEINQNTGQPAYNLASGVSLLLFYAFAMQCMSTIAIVKKETGSWKWTLIQAGMMTAVAYIAAFAAYHLLK